MTDPGAIGWLLASDEPAIRYRTRTWLLDQPEADPSVQADRELIPVGSGVAALLDFAKVATVNPYRKWTGLHWRLISLADFGLPVDRPDIRARLDEGLDRELTWITQPGELEGQARIDGLYRAHATIHGNAVYVASTLGRADDERVRWLVAKLLEWQWPDGGWNCDKRASGYRSSFHESWATALGLAAYHHAIGGADGLAAEAIAAARRTAELLLEHPPTGTTTSWAVCASCARRARSTTRAPARRSTTSSRSGCRTVASKPHVRGGWRRPGQPPRSTLSTGARAAHRRR